MSLRVAVSVGVGGRVSSKSGLFMSVCHGAERFDGKLHGCLEESI